MPASEVCAVTGATGYVGSLIVDAISPQAAVVPLVRRPGNRNDLQWELEAATDISGALRARGVTTLVHAAWDMRANSLDELRGSSVAGSRRLLEMAGRAGVSRFIFISTISAFPGCRSAYGRSKLEVEDTFNSMGGTVLRPGLVFGPHSGGIFGTIREQVRKSKLIPLIGDGRAPQYLLHEKTLMQVIARAVAGDFDGEPSPLTIAHPKAWPFRDIVSLIAEEEGRKVTFIPVPWRILYGGLRTSELMQIKLPVRSDSVISFIYQNLKPDFSKMEKYGVEPLPFHSS